jgi:hypothetical protein
MRNAYKIVTGKPEGKRLLERPAKDGKILELILHKYGGKM